MTNPDRDAVVACLVFRVHRPYFAAVAADRAAQGFRGGLVAAAAPGISRLHLARLRAIAEGMGR